MYWNGTSADSFAGGEGTINNPYEISTADQLFLLANAGTEETKGKYYKLTSDINISKVYDSVYYISDNFNSLMNLDLSVKTIKELNYDFLMDF